jgi:hypothetical protein
VEEDVMRGTEAPRRSQSNHRSPKYKILSLDGGGIYGLVTATWLRRLAEQQPHFLSAPTRDPRLERPPPGSDLTLFAGASSGAVNALLLAKYERPREALLSGVLERFWKHAGVFSNTDPVTAWTSYWGLGAWFGTEDLKRVLDEYFGDLTLKDLPNNVLITCFDWYGHPRDEFIKFDASPQAFSMPGPGASKPRSWSPRTFTNFLPRGNPKDWDYRVADLAYSACAAPGFRAVVGGLADAASSTVNPTVDAIAGLTYLARWHKAHSKQTEDTPRPPRPEPLATTPQAVASPEPTQKGDDDDFNYRSDPLLAGSHYIEAPEDLVEESPELPPPSPADARDELGILNQMGILSLGDGTIEPAYWLESFNFSMTQLQMFPTNPFAGNFYSPQTWLALDAPTKNIDDYARALIGPNRYMRVNPQLLAIPTLVASGIARFPWYRGWLTDYIIPNAVSSPPSMQAVEWAACFLQQDWWLDNKQALATI